MSPITVDVHLSANHLERSKALDNIFKQTEEAISDILIVGDLFDIDGDDSSMHISLTLAESPQAKNPFNAGNHDTEKSMRDLNLENLMIYRHGAPETNNKPKYNESSGVNLNRGPVYKLQHFITKER